VRCTRDRAKENANRRKHKLGFDLSRHVFDDPLLAVVYDRFANRERRFHAIGLGEATPDERKRYEEGGFD
jgi:uncharacterized DUF497 family protein